MYFIGFPFIYHHFQCEATFILAHNGLLCSKAEKNATVILNQLGKLDLGLGLSSGLWLWLELGVRN